MGDEQGAPLKHTTLYPDDSHSSAPEDVESANLMQAQSEESEEDATVAEGQSKHLYSPLLSPPQAKSSQPMSTCAESAEDAGAVDKGEYVVSIPLSLVRLSRKSKSRSSSKDLGGKSHFAHTH